MVQPFTLDQLREVEAIDRMNLAISESRELIAQAKTLQRDSKRLMVDAEKARRPRERFAQAKTSADGEAVH